MWVATRQNVHETWSAPENLGPPVSTEFNEVTPSLSHNGRPLLFASNRPGGFGSQDIWMSLTEIRRALPMFWKCPP
ncbi:MAG: hypothetical protein E6I52_00635 [Chloroflexi bacterium]|nr:MAG: hypothetical protein E6I52_00635 [Chloroflexota bacterium]